jgi:hypothetical protein
MLETTILDFDFADDMPARLRYLLIVHKDKLSSQDSLISFSVAVGFFMIYFLICSCLRPCILPLYFFSGEPKSDFFYIIMQWDETVDLFICS